MPHFCDNGFRRKYSTRICRIFNAGVMGFAALGGLSAVLIAYPPVPETIKLGGKGVL